MSPSCHGLTLKRACYALTYTGILIQLIRNSFATGSQCHLVGGGREAHLLVAVVEHGVVGTDEHVAKDPEWALSACVIYVQ